MYRQIRAHVHYVLEKKPRICVLASGADLSALHAWACATPDELLHYVYVPLELAGNGFARQMITAAYGSYPERVVTTCPWPFKTARFVFEALKRKAA